MPESARAVKTRATLIAPPNQFCELLDESPLTKIVQAPQITCPGNLDE